MATSCKDRQATFKARMRESGKRQMTIWVDGQQERAVKQLLEDGGQEQENNKLVERGFSEEEIAALCVVTVWFGAVTAAHLAGVKMPEILQLLKSPDVKDIYDITLRRHENRRDLDQRAYELDLRQKEIEERESALANRASELTNYALVASTSIRYRIERLVTAFTTEPGKDGQVAIDLSYRADQKAKEMANLSRQTSLASTTIRSLVEHYGKLGILLEKEVTTLIDSGKVLAWVSNSAKQAKDRVTARAKKIAIDEERRQKEAAAAVKRIFPELLAPDAVLLLIHLTPTPFFPYVIGEIRRLVPGNKKDTNYLVEEIVRSARMEAKNKIEKELRTTGRKVDAIVDELLTGFESSKPALLERHGDLVRHIITCITAARLMGVEE